LDSSNETIATVNSVIYYVNYTDADSVAVYFLKEPDRKPLCQYMVSSQVGNEYDGYILIKSGKICIKDLWLSIDNYGVISKKWGSYGVYLDRANAVGYNITTPHTVAEIGTILKGYTLCHIGEDSESCMVLDVPESWYFSDECMRHMIKLVGAVVGDFPVLVKGDSRWAYCGQSSLNSLIEGLAVGKDSFTGCFYGNNVDEFLNSIQYEEVS